MITKKLDRYIMGGMPIYKDGGIDLSIATIYRVHGIDGAVNPLSDNWGAAKRVYGGLVMEPGCCAICTTAEILSIPKKMHGTLGTRSCVAQNFLACMTDSQFVHPGFNGPLILELKNNGPSPILVREGQHLVTLRLFKN